MAATTPQQREDALQLIEQFKQTIVLANAPDENGRCKVAGAAWTDQFFQAMDSLQEIGLVTPK